VAGPGVNCFFLSDKRLDNLDVLYPLMPLDFCDCSSDPDFFPNI